MWSYISYVCSTWSHPGFKSFYVYKTHYVYLWLRSTNTSALTIYSHFIEHLTCACVGPSLYTISAACRCPLFSASQCHHSICHKKVCLSSRPSSCFIPFTHLSLHPFSCLSTSPPSWHILCFHCRCVSLIAPDLLSPQSLSAFSLSSHFNNNWEWVLI
jgi:hypothetical protein